MPIMFLLMVTQILSKKTFWKFRSLIVRMFSPWMRFLSSLLSNNSRKVGSYPMPLHFLLQRHPIKSNKSRKWSLWRKPPLIIQNKFPFFLSNLNSLENGLLTVFNKSWFEKSYSFDVSGLNCWMLWCKTTVTLLCENQTFVKDLKYIFQ